VLQIGYGNPAKEGEKVMPLVFLGGLFIAIEGSTTLQSGLKNVQVG
jgi:hypothetical protein